MCKNLWDTSKAGLRKLKIIKERLNISELDVQLKSLGKNMKETYKK